jgi:hypothetical protein
MNERPGCGVESRELWLFLRGQLEGEAERRLLDHLESCALCQSVPLMETGYAEMLRTKLAGRAAGADLRARVLGRLRGEEAAPARAAPAGSGSLEDAGRTPGTGTASAPVDAAPPGVARYRRLLASSWLPRLAMAAVFAVLLLVPVRALFRSPALAVEAATRHTHHASLYGGPLPACCRDLGLSEGDLLGAPSEGLRIPDLGGWGLHLVAASCCTAGGVRVNQLGYRGPDGAMFSLYLSDQVAEQFGEFRTRAGSDRARSRVRAAAVTTWKRGGIVHLWVGPHADPNYDLALAALVPPE